MQHHHIQFHCRLDRRHIGPSPSLNKIRVQHIIRLFPSGTHVKMNTFPRICLSIDLTLMTHTAICLIRVSNDVERQLDLVFVSEVCPKQSRSPCDDADFPFQRHLCYLCGRASPSRYWLGQCQAWQARSNKHLGKLEGKSIDYHSAIQPGTYEYPNCHERTVQDDSVNDVKQSDRSP